MRKILGLALMFIFCFTSLCFGADQALEISWDNNTEKDLAGYTLYIVNDSGEPLSDPIDVPYTVDGSTPVLVEHQITLPEDSITIVCAQVSAYDSSENESDVCDPACVSVDLSVPPAVPTTMTIKVKIIPVP